MNKYEMAVILRANLEDDARNEEFEKIQGLITRFGGEVEKVDEWGRRRLAYEIEKQTEGYYSFITFMSDAGAPAEVESRVRIMENVLRYLIIRKDA